MNKVYKLTRAYIYLSPADLELLPVDEINTYYSSIKPTIFNDLEIKLQDIFEY